MFFYEYEMDFDDEHCLYCGADLDNTFPAETDEDVEANDEGWCNVECKTKWEENGEYPSDDWGKPKATPDDHEEIAKLDRLITKAKYADKETALTLEEFTKGLPKGDFDWSDGEAGDAHVYNCGEKDCPVGWHLAYYATDVKRVDGKLSIEVSSGDSDGNWDYEAGWEEGDDFTEVAYYLGGGLMNDYFIDWAEYWLDAALTGEDPCDMLNTNVNLNNWVAICIAASEDNVKYLKK
jgi:hypothetical protein